MAKKGKKVLEFDGKSAAAGDVTDDGPAAATAGTNGHGEVFSDVPLDDAAAIARLIELNHERNTCAARWEDAKAEASEAKKELDNASNAISLLIDQIDRQRSGQESAQPVLRTLADVGADLPQ
jgi:hypothetical protein